MGPWLRKVEEMYLLLLDEAEEFDLEDDSNLSEAQRNKVKNLKQDIVRFVSAYNLTYSTRMMEAMNLAGSASLSSSDPASRAASHASEERYRRTVAEVEVDAERLSADIETLRKEVTLVDDWSDATDHQVEVNVVKTEDWKKRMRQLWEIFYKVKTAVRAHDLDDETLQNAERAVKVLEAEVENAIENLLHEDEVRCLYSQSKRKTADRKYPKFSGADEKQEDFEKFEKDVREVFKANRVARDDQVKKLCEECLESPAKNLIPETVKTLDRALETLRGRYGGGISNSIKIKKGRKIPSPPVTSEEEIFAQMMNRGELAQFVDPEEVINNGQALDDGHVAGDLEVDEDAHQDDHRLGSSILCGQCGVDILESPGEIVKTGGQIFIDVTLETESDPNLCDLKTLMKMNEDGITVDYKCPKCRNCESCRNPYDTERISQREEVEDEAIKDSVVVDRVAGKITAKLPFRGDENQYLSNNRQVALKILDGQCENLN